MASMLEKAGCELVKSMGQLDFEISHDNMRSPSAKASNFERRLFTDIWSAGGKELADEAAKKNARKVSVSHLTSYFFLASSVAYTCYFSCRFIRPIRKLK